MNIKKFLAWWIKGIKYKIKKMSKEKKRLIIVSILALIIGGMIGNSIGHSVDENCSEEKVAEAVAEVQQKKEEETKVLEKDIYDLKEELGEKEVGLPWYLVLVNSEHPMEEGYVPELMELEEGYSVDSRILDATREMLNDAKEAGMRIEICSAYRSVKRQGEVFGDSMKERVKSGLGYWEAYCETASNVAVPGTSEHALGLALDLISNQYTELDEAQEDTAEAKWLKENCYKYGFILRYPPEKTNITGIIYEPWHYRYVGVEHATEIMRLGITLEEYLQDYYQPEEGQ